MKVAIKNELKPCPFCGSTSTGVVETAYGNYANIFYFAVCDRCGARTKSFRDGDDASEAWNRRQEKENAQPREITIQEEMEAYIKEYEKELLDAAVSTAVKRDFAFKYMGKQVTERIECYFCQYCRRERYIKSEWLCAKFKPGEPPEGFTCFRKREKSQNEENVHFGNVEVISGGYVKEAGGKAKEQARKITVDSSQGRF